MQEKRPQITSGQKLRQARLQAGIATQKELAAQTGIPPNIISDLERDRRELSPKWARRIGEVLGEGWAKDQD